MRTLHPGATPPQLAIELGLVGLAVAISTLVAHWLTLRMAFTPWHDVSLVEAFAGGRGGQFALLILADLFDAAAVAAVTLLLAEWVALRWRLALEASAIALISLVAFVAWASPVYLGGPITIDSAIVALRWGSQHPAAAAAPLANWRLSAGLAAVVLWTRLWYSALRDTSTWRARLRDGATATKRTFFVCAVGLLALGAKSVLPDPGFRAGFWVPFVVSFVDRDSHNPLHLNPPAPGVLQQQWDAVTLQPSIEGNGQPFSHPKIVAARRHIIVVELETAPLAYYAIGSDTTLAALHEMAEHAVVSTHHQTTSLSTTWAVYSIVSGTYPRPGRPIACYGDIDIEGALPAALAADGYQTVFIDSYRADWEGGHRNSQMLHELGFETVLDGAMAPNTPTPTSEFDFASKVEAFSFSRALDRVLTADAGGKKAFVFLSTSIGHFPWATPPANANASARQRLGAIGRVIDGAVGGLLRGLAQRGLLDSTIVVITGDHGLRFPAEFAAVGNGAVFDSLSTNVPLLIYAPAAFKHRVDLDFVTSHVDIAPTLLEMVGISPNQSLFHGESIFSPDAARHAAFTWSSGVAPANYVFLRGGVFAIGTTSSRTVWSNGHLVPERAAAAVRELSDSARTLIDLSAASFLRAGRKKYGSPSPQSVCLGI